MKIIYYAHSLLNRGGDKMVLAHAGWLAAHGHEVELCCNVVDTVLNIPDGIRISRPFLPGKVGTVLSAIFEKRSANLVLASIIPMACFLFPRSRRKVVYFAQDYNVNSYQTVIQKLCLHLLHVVGLQFFRIPVVSVSEHLAEIFRGRYKANVQVVLNGVDLESFYPEPREDLIALKRGKKAILIFSRRDPRKGFDLSLAVLNRLAGVDPSTCVVWTVGEHLNEGEVALPHRDFGYLKVTELRQIYSSADILLYPSRNEGFGLMPLEAMACGCPVVTTTAIPYALHGENALVSQVEDCISLTEHAQELLGDNDRCSSIAESGIKFAHTYSLKQATQKFENVIVGMVQT